MRSRSPNMSPIVDTSGGTTFATFIGSGTDGIIGLLNTIVLPTIVAFMFVIFVWGIVKYFFLNVDDEKARESGRQFALWGVLGLVILFSIWGLVNILLSTLGIHPGS